MWYGTAVVFQNGSPLSRRDYICRCDWNEVYFRSETIPILSPHIPAVVFCLFASLHVFDRSQQPHTRKEETHTQQSTATHPAENSHTSEKNSHTSSRLQPHSAENSHPPSREQPHTSREQPHTSREQPHTQQRTPTHPTDNSHIPAENSHIPAENSHITSRQQPHTSREQPHTSREQPHYQQRTATYRAENRSQCELIVENSHQWNGSSSIGAGYPGELDHRKVRILLCFSRRTSQALIFGLLVFGSGLFLVHFSAEFRWVCRAKGLR